MDCSLGKTFSTTNNNTTGLTITSVINIPVAGSEVILIVSSAGGLTVGLTSTDTNLVGIPSTVTTGSKVYVFRFISFGGKLYESTHSASVSGIPLGD
jgi:hypothetical protein